MLEDDAAVALAVAERSDELAASLARVRGAVELSVRAVTADADGDAGGATSGAEYLRTRARSTAAREAVARSLREPLAALSRADFRRAPRPPAELLRAAYLVDRDAVGTFSRLVARLDRRHPNLRLLCTGPWPPYSFAER